MKRIPVLHPFLITIFPIVSLYAANADEVPFAATLRSLLISIGTISILLGTINIFIKDIKKAGILSSVITAFFFSFRFLLDATPEIKTGEHLILEKHWVLLAGELLLLLACGLLLVLTKKNLKNMTVFLNTSSLFLIILPLVCIVKTQYEALRVLPIEPLQEDTLSNKLEDGSNLPDIYYILLDGHARGDILKDVFQLSDYTFEEELEKRGFYVAKKSRTNYAQTSLSLASSLNFKYLTPLIEQLEPNSTNRNPLADLIENNEVQQLLKNVGYTRITFKSVSSGKDSAADIDITYTVAPAEFEIALLQTTPLYSFLSKKVLIDLHKAKILHTLNSIPQVAHNEQPTFTYAHILPPHPPFVFDRRGETPEMKGWSSGADGDNYAGSREEYWEGYRNQVQFIDEKILEMIDSILKNSAKPPIIIIQSDHGSGYGLRWESAEKTDMRERMSILNAYYFPQQKYEVLYASVSPVNTFRIIFNQYFGTQYELLEDKSYFSEWSRPYDPLEIPNDITGNAIIRP